MSFSHSQPYLHPHPLLCAISWALIACYSMHFIIPSPFYQTLRFVLCPLRSARFCALTFHPKSNLIVTCPSFDFIYFLLSPLFFVSCHAHCFLLLVKLTLSLPSIDIIQLRNIFDKSFSIPLRPFSSYLFVLFLLYMLFALVTLRE